jgi:hypothetical protein
MAGHLIFGCSSRGAKLEHFLEQRIPIDDWYYHIIVKPGGTIKQIQNEINNSMDSTKQQNTKPHLLYLCIDNHYCMGLHDIPHKSSVEETGTFNDM